MASIQSISGVDAPSGGGASVPASTTGLLYYGGISGGQYPVDVRSVNDYLPSIHAYQLSSRTDFVDLKFSFGGAFALTSGGDLYSAGGTNTSYLGRSFTNAPADEFHVSLTGVSKFAPFNNGCWAIKTNGTLWWCGAANSMINSSGSGQATTTASQTWLQYGTDTDWIDIVGNGVEYPYSSLAIKGDAANRQRYLYSCGYNNYGVTGLGLASGVTYNWTRVKADASNDFAEDVVNISMGVRGSMCVTQDGKMYCWGEANESGQGTGSATDQLYPYQPTIYGDSAPATNWVKVFAGVPTIFAINEDGELYGSARVSYTGVKLFEDNGGYFKRIGSQTGWEDIRFANNYQIPNLTYKRNGNWYIHGVLNSGDWTQRTSFLNIYQGIYTDIGMPLNDADSTNTIPNDVTLAVPYLSTSNASSPYDLVVIA